MATKLWLRNEDQAALMKIWAMDLTAHNEGVLTGLLTNEGILSRMKKDFVLGKVKIWLPREAREHGGTGYSFVRINNHSSYPNGLVLTPYSHIEVQRHLGTRTIDQFTKLSREELLGGSDFVARVFNTYYTLIPKPTEREDRFILYETKQ